MNPEEKEPTEEAQAAEQEQPPAPADEAPAAKSEEASAGEAAVATPEKEEVPAGEAAAATPEQGPAPSGERAEPSRGPERRRRHYGRRKVCAFCVENVRSIDYKDAAKLRRYLSDRGRIEARRKTGTCAKHQRWLATALKRARHLALLPYTPEHIRLTGTAVARR